MSTSGRDRVRLGEDEVAALLAENLKVQVAANGHDGLPHLTTLFYVVRDGRIAFWTYGRSQKIRNLERDPRISALVEDGTDYFELRGVSIRGRAEIVRDRATILEIGSAVVARMAGVDSLEALGDLGRETVEKQATKRVGVIVHPEKVASWDHRKMT
ncbi:pyridoxamine 5'-phosphate oxidase family protein [Nocardioides sp. zg-ZUI104]|uniref:pyridoxamine 5'-phosphate oxidase family protein n=1 Tax=Nocardioides faecalis TaxID=2803858 RepID=UPI001BCCA193|nr:pyridoxamine 5'-phosphate oxidase family protein [Nocardioides faecalis]MBS4754325.1 pyridoxamine 5'-phosphate oxidase family protein [Nocardioides faecalis]